MNESRIESGDYRKLKRLQRDWRIWWGGTILFALILCALGASWLTHYDPNFQANDVLTTKPSFAHWFGTDSLGRDLYARVLYGSRVSMAVAFVTALSGLLLGCLYGGVAGMVGGKVDTVLMRALDLFYTVPTLLLLIFLNTLCGQGLTGILVALSLEGMLTVARLVRGQVLQIKQADFVSAAQALGASAGWILIKHLLPNLLGPIIVTVAFLIPTNVMYEAFLSFVGLGIQPPYSSWGTLANEGWRGLISHPHLIFFPGAAIFITMLAFNILGDGLRDALDPKASKGEFS
jgi:ABC-type dipeptide/oligopeptide/nickel transport system permease subunit